jgi:hypothetical protein
VIPVAAGAEPIDRSYFDFRATLNAGVTCPSTECAEFQGAIRRGVDEGFAASLSEGSPQMDSAGGFALLFVDGELYRELGTAGNYSRPSSMQVQFAKLLTMHEVDAEGIALAAPIHHVVLNIAFPTSTDAPGLGTGSKPRE